MALRMPARPMNHPASVSFGPRTHEHKSLLPRVSLQQQQLQQHEISSMAPTSTVWTWARPQRQTNKHKARMARNNTKQTPHAKTCKKQLVDTHTQHEARCSRHVGTWARQHTWGNTCFFKAFSATCCVFCILCSCAIDICSFVYLGHLSQDHHLAQGVIHSPTQTTTHSRAVRAHTHTHLRVNIPLKSSSFTSGIRGINAPQRFPHKLVCVIRKATSQTQKNLPSRAEQPKTATKLSASLCSSCATAWGSSRETHKCPRPLLGRSSPNYNQTPENKSVREHHGNCNLPLAI